MFDLHCHLIFDVDDGARSLSESKAMLMAASRCELDHIVCTPHCRDPWWNPEGIAKNFPIIQEQAEALGITLALGFEVNWKKIPDLGMDAMPRLAIGDTNLFLLEFSDTSMPPRWQSVIRGLQSKGLQPVIAHPERYLPVQRDIEIAAELKDMGCLLQLSANFIDEKMFGNRKHCATQLLKRGLVDYIASDAHRAADYQTYRKALAYAQRF